MNQDLLLRLFRSIDAEPSEDIVLVAKNIIDDETAKGHIKLAKNCQKFLQKT